MLLFINDPSDILLIRRMYSVFTNPSPDLLEFLCKSCSECRLYKIKEALEVFSKQVQLPTVSSSEPRTRGTVVPVSHDGGYTNSSIHSFRLGVWVCRATSWTELVQRICEIVCIEHKEIFVENAKLVEGKRRIYFSADRMALEKPHPVGGIYVETNLSANNSVSFAKGLARQFGYETPQINPRYLPQ